MVFGAPVAASASQSLAPPRPFVSVAVTLAPGATVVALTASAGGGATVKANEADVPPPGAGVKTVTGTVPAVATSAAAIAVVRRVALTKVVGRSAPFQRTTDPLTKPLPSTVSVNAVVPAGTLAGVSALSVGTGAVTVTAGLVAALT